jgi:hypothetical protein
VTVTPPSRRAVARSAVVGRREARERPLIGEARRVLVARRGAMTSRPRSLRTTVRLALSASIVLSLLGCSGGAPPESTAIELAPVGRARQVEAPPPAPAAEQTTEVEGTEGEDDEDTTPPPEGMARLVVESDPDGAAVFLEDSDESVGNTPLELSLAPGAHVVEIAMEDDLTARGEGRVEGGRIYRFFAVLPNDEDPVERDALSVHPREIVALHRDQLSECGALADGATELGFAEHASGVVEMAQAFGTLPMRALRCASIEMLSWRLPAQAGDSYYVFASSLAEPGTGGELTPTPSARSIRSREDEQPE